MELKRKQRLQSVLDKRLSFIDNIQQVLHTIEQTQTDKEVPHLASFALLSYLHTGSLIAFCVCPLRDPLDA
jgi:hypothetical protein